VLFVFKQRKRHISSRVSEDYEDIDEAEDSKSTYTGNNNTHWTIKKRDILFLTITLANLRRFL